ncbi:LLM class flavin-dependent oxidoreductase [Flavisphingomonas formosensis]|uniref:LLM class flavin-dependent oxidoreductase n=1 Tax=Flavisphingomonas formosensis TaxID=861534 RepID=UPI0012F8A561|nr:LLM class flavin-dependent oxidoreductase [Sphingomonas formosensis]
MRLSIVDVCPVMEGRTPQQAVRDAIGFAQEAEALGFTRYWLAEHHGAGSVGSQAPEVLIPVIAGETQRIRVGSGAVLLNHYSPLKVAEQFRTLAALFPGRIDLGTGRAFAGPVADVALMRHRTQRRVDDHREQMVELAAWVAQDMPKDHPFATVQVMPDMAEMPMLWLLGSSDASPRLAGLLGLRYVFAGFIAPERAVSAMRSYRQHFEAARSPAGVRSPEAILAVHVICAETRAEAERLAMPVRHMYASLAQGRIGKRLASIETAIGALGSVPPAEQEPWPRFVIGDPDEVRARLLAMAGETGVEEIMVQDMIVPGDARRRSWRLLAEAFDLSGAANYPARPIRIRVRSRALARNPTENGPFHGFSRCKCWTLPAIGR